VDFTMTEMKREIVQLSVVLNGKFSRMTGS